MPECRYDTIIFDLGRVLVNWDPLKSVQELALEDSSFDIEIYKITQSPFWYLFDIGQLTIAEMIDYFSKSYSRHQLIRFFSKVMADLTPLEFGVQLLGQIREAGFQTFVLSNMSKEFFDHIYATHEYMKGFHGGVYSFEAYTMKPDLKVYLKLLNKYDKDSATCLFLDDMECNIFSAKRAGIDSILYSPNDELIALLKAKHII